MNSLSEAMAGGCATGRMLGFDPMLRDFAALSRASRAAALLVAFLAAALAGCGIKGPLKPPPPKTVQTAPATGGPAIGAPPGQPATPTDTQDRERKP
jgi:predicted small lipoprotein YifL